MSLNVFSSGAPGSASEVNENFNYLEEKVDVRLKFKKIWEYEAPSDSSSSTTINYTVPERPVFDFVNNIYSVRFSGFSSVTQCDRLVIFGDLGISTIPRLTSDNGSTVIDLQALNGLYFNIRNSRYFIDVTKYISGDQTILNDSNHIRFRFGSARVIPAGWKVEIFESEL